MSDTKQEIESDQRADRRRVREDAELLQGLIKHPGWPRYTALLEAVGQNFFREAMKPLEHALEITKTEYAKGSLNGLTLAASLPSAKINEAAQLRTGEDDHGA